MGLILIIRMNKLLFIAFLSFTSIILPASYACERLNKPVLGKEWKGEGSKYIAIVNNEKVVRCDINFISKYENAETYRIYAFGLDKNINTVAYECEQFSIIRQTDLDELYKEAWILVDKNKKEFYLNAGKDNCICKDTGTNEKRNITLYCKRNLQEDFTKIQLKSETEFVLIDKERPQL